MNRFRYIGFLLAIVLSPLLSAQTRKPTAKVKTVVSAECVIVRKLDFYGKETKDEERLYIAGIDCPDPGQPYAEEAMLELVKLVQDKAVHVEYLVEDPMYLTLCDLYVGDRNVGDWMILQGHAWPAQHNDKQSASAFLASARTGKKGMWASGERRIAPWQYRKEQIKTCRVNEVIRGNAFRAQIGRRELIVQLYGTSSPWPYDPDAEKAKKYLIGRIEGKTVELEIEDDCRQVLGAKVKLDGADIGVEMVAKGLLWHNVLRALTDEELDAAGDKAAKARLGVHAESEATPAWETHKQPANLEKWFVPEAPPPETPEPHTLLRLVKVQESRLPFYLSSVMVQDPERPQTWTYAFTFASTDGRKKPRFIQFRNNIPGTNWFVSDAQVDVNKEKNEKVYIVELRNRNRPGQKTIARMGKPIPDPNGKTRYYLAYFPGKTAVKVDHGEVFKLSYKDKTASYRVVDSLDGRKAVENTRTQEQVLLKDFDKTEYDAWAKRHPNE